MAVTLLGIRNSGIKITDTLSIPVVKAIVDVTANSNASEMNTLYDEIYSRSAGLVSVCAYVPGTRMNSAGSGLVNGTYGTTTGFKLQIICGGSGNNRYLQNVILYFNNIVVSNTITFTGYAPFETVYAVIFVDENDNIHRFVGSGYGGLYVLAQAETGISVQDNKYAISPIIGGYSIRYNNSNIALLSTQKVGSIDDYILNEINPEITDPFTPGGDSGTGGGTGDFDGTGDDVDIPGLPTLSAVDTGFISLFNPSAGELRSLANYMWSNPLFDLNAWKKIFADPMDAILGLSIVPVNVPNGGQSAVTVGNISTGVSMNKAAAQYVEVDCGTLNVNEFWGAYLDYDPFTKAEIYLPYIGTHPLSVDDIMGKAVHVVYHVDILSGACCAFVKCGGSVLYTFVGQCAASIPITGNDWTNVINGVMSIAASIGTMVATGGASAPFTAGAVASTAVNSMKPNVEKSGSLGGTGGMLGVQTPYLILTRPRQAVPSGQNAYTGYPSYITRKLDDLEGYTEVDSIHLDGIPATEQEMSEIESLLKNGVIL